MAFVLQQLALPPLGLYGFLFKKGQILSEYLSDAENHWFLLEEQLPDNATSKLTSLTEQEARIALNSRDRIAKITKDPFCVNLHFEDLKLSDNNTLELNIKIRVRISNPIRFYRRYIAQFKNEPTLDGDSLHKLWETPFRNVLLVETHKIDYESWETSLVGPAIAAAFKNMYYAPMAAKYVDGTELELVESVSGYSPSVQERLEKEKKELEKQQKELEDQKEAIRRQQEANIEKEKLEITHAHNQAKLKAERDLLIEQNRKKELEIKAKEAEIKAKETEINIIREKRLAQEEENKRRLQQEQKEAQKQRDEREHEQRIALIQSNKWPDITQFEKDIAIEFSILMNNQMDENNIAMKNMAISANSLFYKGVAGEWNTLRKGGMLGFSFTAPQSGYVTILNLGTSGKMTVLLPNAITGSDTDLVKVQQGVKYLFPKSFMPDIDEDSFIEMSDSGMEGIYTIITPKPLLPCPQGELISLSVLPYSVVKLLIEKFKKTPPESWSVGSLEFQVIP